MPRHRRLTDLYVRGQDLTIDDGEGSVTVWIAKLNSVDRETVFRRAQAAKARFMIESDNEDGDVFAEEYARVREYDDRDGLVTLAISEDLQKSQDRIDAELAADEETWGKDGYLQGLVDSWLGTADEPGLTKTIEEDPEDPDAVKVKTEIDRFTQEVAHRVAEERDRLKAEWNEVPDDDLWRHVARYMLKSRAIDVFVKEMNRQQLFFAVREPGDHKKRYFGTLAEVDDLDDNVKDKLAECLTAMTVDAIEGKDSPETQGSSPPSESPNGQGEPSDSGQETVSA